MSSIADPLRTIPEAARRFRVHPETVRRWVKLGLIEGVKLTPGTLRIRESELGRFEGIRDRLPPAA
jgi:excisionase family DNA binding protein